MTKGSELDTTISAVRRFSRFYTRQIGLLREGYLDSPYTLAQVRLLYELAHRPTTTASELSRELGLDPGYLSRLLRDFKKRGLIEKRPSATDARSSVLSLTGRGRRAFAPLEARSHKEIGTMLTRLHSPDQRRLVQAMCTVEGLLGPRSLPAVPYVLRPPQAGDMGWVIARHGVLYSQEYGWDEQFEALVAGIVAKFMQHFDPRRERCWIAERDGENVGCVFAVKESASVARLRLLLVEPQARGVGIGARLVDECIRFARRSGYRKLTLWTNDVLVAARHIYEEAGFRMVHQGPHHAFGHDLIEQTWDLKL